MKLLLYLCYSLLFSSFCFSQKGMKQVINIAPEWVYSNAATIKNQAIRTDSVFRFNKRKNNHDSVLVLIQHYDASGNIMERIEYSFNKQEVYKTTNFTYLRNILSKKEIVAQSFFEINGSNITRDVSTYMYDSLGNNITEKQYSHDEDTLSEQSMTFINKEYDTKGHILKEFQKMAFGKLYLYHTYVYKFGTLSEIKSFDLKENLMYSTLHEFDNELNMENIFLYNIFHEKTLQYELYYDERKQLIQKKNYTGGHFVLDHSTQSYSYSPDGLILTESFQDIRGTTYYYRHFYSDK